MNTTFNRQLAAIHRKWLGGLVLRAALHTAALAVVIVFAAALLDLAQPWSDGARPWLALVLALAALGVFFHGLWALRRHRTRQTARELDRALDDTGADMSCQGRGLVLGAAELAAGPEPPPEGLYGWLRQRAIDRAATALKGLPRSARWPARAIRRHALRAAAALGAVLLLAAVFPGPVGTSLKRVLLPAADVPPHAPFAFGLPDEDPSVFYGDDLLLAVDITGAEVRGAVWAEVRDPATGALTRARCFRGPSGTSFTHRLEQVVGPVEVRFATGRAWSRWVPVEVLFQPRITSAALAVSPPAYSGLPVEEFPLGSRDLRALEGSHVTLTLTSNRPLSRGQVAVTPHNERLRERLAGDHEFTAAGTPEITMDWPLHASATVRIEIADLLGTPSAAPLEFNQTALPDEAPEVRIVEPPPLALATPASTLPMTVEAIDDLGLARVSLVRSLVGFRDRLVTLADRGLDTRFSHREEIDLASLGVRPGDELEFFVEAADANPSLLGIATSEIVRITIISEEEYAEIVRARSTLEEFITRFQLAADAMDEARSALEALEAAAAGDPEALAEAAAAAAEALAAARETLEALAADFPAFELEHDLRDAAATAAEPLNRAADALAQLGDNPDPEAAALAAREALDQLGQSHPGIEEAHEMARLAAAAGRLFELAGELREIHANQESLAERFDSLARQFASGSDANIAQLDGLARLQEDNAGRLRETAAALREQAAALPPELAELREQVEAFSQALDAGEIDTLMDAAAEHAGGGRSAEAAASALLAFEALDLLFQGDNAMAAACRGGDGWQFNLSQSLAQTMNQMMRSLAGGSPAGGTGTGAGTGTGGGSGPGAGRRGAGVPMPGGGVPAYGPGRMALAALDAGRGGGGASGGAGQGGDTPDVAGAAGMLDTVRDPDIAPPPPVERVPGQYREAVKRYFDYREPTTPTPSSDP